MESLLSFFISDAFAESNPAQQGGGLAGLLPLFIIMIVFYFMLIRPQSKRMKETKAMIDSLKKGDEVVTTGGVLAKVTEVGDSFLSVDAGEGTTLTIQRQSIGSLVPKGTIKELKKA
jgi:preprotein translocase subunit YajC